MSGTTRNPHPSRRGGSQRSGAFRQVLARAGVIPQAHPPYRPQYNGNVERLNLTLDREWAYVRSYTSN
jgi:transposase InsO family protein